MTMSIEKVSKKDYLEKMEMKTLFFVSSHHVFEIMYPEYEVDDFKSDFKDSISLNELSIEGLNLPSAVSDNDYNYNSYICLLQKSMVAKEEKKEKERFFKKHSKEDISKKCYRPDYEIKETLSEAIDALKEKARENDDSDGFIQDYQVLLMSVYQDDMEEKSRLKCAEQNVYLIPEELEVVNNSGLPLVEIFKLGLNNNEIFILNDYVTLDFSSARFALCNSGAANHQVFTKSGSYSVKFGSSMKSFDHYAISPSELYNVDSKDKEVKYFMSKEDMFLYSQRKMKETLVIHEDAMNSLGLKIENNLNYQF